MNMIALPSLWPLPSVPAEENGPPRCIEILGGNVRRAEALLLGGLEVLLVAQPTGGGGGGDIYCMHSCGHGALAKFVLIDVTGHGQARDAFARSVHDLLHRFSDETQPARLLDRLNHDYDRLSHPMIYATAVSAAYEPGRHEFRFSNAGQPRPLHWSAENQRWRIVQPAKDSDCGLPLGIREAACYVEESISLAEGDILFLSSDGLPEALNERDEFLEPEGVVALLQESAAKTPADSPLVKLASAFLRRVERDRGRREFEDDLTLLWLRRLPTGAVRGAQSQAA
jgi:phosphoserine phosphatase RsbU/P